MVYVKIVMMKKNLFVMTHLAKLSVIAVLVASLLSLGFYVRAVIEDLPKEHDDPVVEQIYTVSLNDYKVYQFNDIRFDFVLANVTITSNLAFDLPQDPFTTSENINLSNGTEYSDPLIADGYQLNCPLPVSDTELSKTYCLFIPVVNRSLNELILKVALDRTYNLSFNMNDTAHTGTRGMLGLEDPVNQFMATILDSTVINTATFYTVDQDGNHHEASFPTNAQVFGFQVTLENATSKPIQIESAYLTIDAVGTYQSVDITYLNDDHTNLLGVDVTSLRTGYLMFSITDSTIDLYSLQDSAIHLLIKLKGSDTYIEIQSFGA